MHVEDSEKPLLTSWAAIGAYTAQANPNPHEKKRTHPHTTGLDFIVINPPFYSSCSSTPIPSRVDGRLQTEMTSLESSTRGGESGFTTKVISDSLALQTGVGLYTTMLSSLSTFKTLCKTLENYVTKKSIYKTFLRNGDTVRYGLGWTYGCYEHEFVLERDDDCGETCFVSDVNDRLILFFEEHDNGVVEMSADAITYNTTHYKITCVTSQDCENWNNDGYDDHDDQDDHDNHDGHDGHDDHNCCVKVSCTAYIYYTQCDDNCVLPEPNQVARDSIRRIYDVIHAEIGRFNRKWKRRRKGEKKVEERKVEEKKKEE
jgi:hypothetical protein